MSPTINTRLSPHNQIELFFHCARCLELFKEKDVRTFGESPESFARLSVGFTAYGIQVWCVRHDLNVVNIDFEGEQHPAITGAAA